MPTQLPKTWTTDRLRLRPFARGDVDDVLAYACDETWGRFLPVPIPYERSDAETFIGIQLAADHGVAPRWALAHEGSAVGSVELKIENGQGVATLHYSIARPLWGRGLMTEAAQSVIDKTFSGLPAIMRIETWADVRNEGSWRVMQKLGMKREGVFRSCRVVHGERVDDVRYAILRDEWSQG